MARLRSHSSTLTLIGFFIVQVAYLLWTTRATPGVDYAAYYLASRALLQDRNVYTLSATEWQTLQAAAHVPDVAPPYRYPPLLVGALRPLATLPFTTSLLIWRIGTIGALLLTSLCLSQFFRQRWIDPIVFAAAAFFIPALTTLYAGQANTFVLAALALWLVLDQRHHLRWAGMALAFSILIKPLAIALAAYLLWRREWKRLAALVLGLIISVAIMVIIAGLSANIDYVRSAWDVTPSGSVAYPPNQSVFAFFTRLLTQTEYGPAITNQPAIAQILSLITVSVLALGVAYLTWPRQHPESFMWGAGLVLVTFSLIIPTSWYHHLTIDLIPWLLAWFALPRRGWRIALLVAYALIAVQGLLWKSFTGQTLLLSLGTYGLLIIYAALAARLWAVRYSDRHAGS